MAPRGVAAASGGVEDLMDDHGAALHRLGSALTGDGEQATALVARVLSGAVGTSPSDPVLRERSLRERLVRDYLRTTPRRSRDTVPTAPEDAGDVLRGLAPRARAALALREVAGAGDVEIAAVLGISARRLERLVPATPGLEIAISAVADQHSARGESLRDDLRAVSLTVPPTQGPASRRWWWIAAAAVAVLLVGGYAVTLDRGDARSVEEDASPGPDGVSLRDAGLELDDDGEPPNLVLGLRLEDTLQLRPGTPVDLMLSGATSRGAMFAVLWCDMPPARDDVLTPPSGQVDVWGESLSLPCAGSDGDPPVTPDHLVALPGSGIAQVEFDGDLPADADALLALYVETDLGLPPLPSRVSRDGAPAVPGDAVVVQDRVENADMFLPGARFVQAVEIGSDSVIRVWAGATGVVTVLVDGVPVTDDGDLAQMLTGSGSWQGRRPDLRDGSWWVYGAGEVREFPLPEQVLPAAGQRRTATVEVVAEADPDYLQVVATDATTVDVDTTALEPLDDGATGAPALLTGHRLVGAWEVPRDGYPRELVAAPDPGAQVAWVVLGAPRAPDDQQASGFRFWAEATLQQDGAAAPIWYPTDEASLSVELRLARYQSAELGGGTGPLRVTSPAVPGEPTMMLLAYEPVAYEDFDFQQAAVPTDSWPAGEDRPPDLVTFESIDYAQVHGTVGREDLDDGGRATVELPAGDVGARITTEGKGRIRFLLDGDPVERLWDSQGWWSSWTDEAVTTETWLVYGAYPEGQELTVVVEDYDDVEIEILTP